MSSLTHEFRDIFLRIDDSLKAKSIDSVSIIKNNLTELLKRICINLGYFNSKYNWRAQK